MKKLLPLVIFTMVISCADAQQLHFTSQYLQHNAMYNPAAAGIANKNMVGVSFRNQWNSFPGNPRTYMVYSDFVLEKLKAGIGAYAYRDETGPTSRTGVQLAYSKHIIANNGKDKFGLGLELRGLQYAIDKNKLSSALANDPALAGAENKVGIDAGAGAYYTNGKLSVGAAVSQLIQSKLQLSDVPNRTQGGKLYRHYNFTANYKWNTGGDIYLIPNAMVRVIEHAPSEYEFGMIANYQEKVWWGVGYRVKQSISLQVGFKIMEKVSLGYSYDYYQTPIDLYTQGSGAHEIGLRFQFKKSDDNVM